MKKWDFQGELGNPSTEYHKKICTLFKNEQAARNLKKIIWDFVKNLNIRPSHGALNYEAALQASQHSDKIGNQYSLNIHQKLSTGEGRRQFVGGAGALASSHVVVALVRLPSDSGDTCGLTWLLFFFFRHPNFSPNIDNIYIIFGLSRKKIMDSREECNRDCSWRRGRKKYKTRNVWVNTTKQVSNS